MGEFEWTPVASIQSILYCLWLWECDLRETWSKAAFKALAVTRLNEGPSWPWYFGKHYEIEKFRELHKMWLWMVFPNALCCIKCQWIVCGGNKLIYENPSSKQEACNLSKVSKSRQLIFWLLAAVLRCSAEAKQAPVDNHLLCGERQREMEQMALVVFCCGCFLWIRNALLNAKLSGRAGANWCPPAPRSSTGSALLLCVCSNSRVTGEVCSFIDASSSGMYKPCGNFITSPSPPPSLTYSHLSLVDETWFSCSRKITWGK